MPEWDWRSTGLQPLTLCSLKNRSKAEPQQVFVSGSHVGATRWLVPTHIGVTTLSYVHVIRTMLGFFHRYCIPPLLSWDNVTVGFFLKKKKKGPILFWPMENIMSAWTTAVSFLLFEQLYPFKAATWASTQLWSHTGSRNWSTLTGKTCFETVFMGTMCSGFYFGGNSTLNVPIRFQICVGVVVVLVVVQND